MTTRRRTTGLAVFLWTAASSGLFGQASAPGADRAALVPALDTKPQYVPLTERERLNIYLKKLVSPEAAVRAAFGSGIDQLEDSPKEWGQGALGYARRFGSAYAEHVVRETLMFGTSSALHEDNHYVRSGEGAFGKRVKYALESSILARHDDGTRHISISKITSFMGASLIWRSWQPPSTHSLGDAAENFGISMAVSAGFDVAREFLPDLFHRKGGS